MPDGLDELNGIIVVLLDAGADRENVHVENDVLGSEADLLGEQSIGAPADIHFALSRDRLAFFIKGHDDDGGAIALDESSLMKKLFFPFLQADGVDDGFSLNAFQAGFDDRPFRAIDHDGNSGDAQVRGDEVQEPSHSFVAVDETFVHVDVEDVGAGLDLFACDGERPFEIAAADQAGKALRAGDVGALADHDEVALRTDDQRLGAAQRRPCWDLRGTSRRNALDGFGNGVNPLGRRAAAAAH